MTPEDRDEMAVIIGGAPLPGDGQPPWERNLSDDEKYGMAAESLAHGLLILCRDDPSLLEGVDEYGDNQKLWAAFEDRWPAGNDWLGDVTGFQFGWAHNAVRAILGAAPAANPAILEIEVP